MSDLNWQDEASCRGVDPDTFFPEKHDMVTGREAKAICRSCAVCVECLEFAVTEKIDHGIWGGTNSRERQMIRIRRARLAATR